MKIKILGTGCKNCILLEKNVKKVVNEFNTKTNIAIITEIYKILDYELMMIPWFMPNKQAYSSGKALSAIEIVGILKKIT